MIQLEVTTDFFTCSLFLTHEDHLPRPLWTFGTAPQGWLALRQVLFGDTVPVCRWLYRQRGELVIPAALYHMTTRHRVHEAIRDMLLARCHEVSAEELAYLYLEWEDTAFDLYRRYFDLSS